MDRFAFIINCHKKSYITIFSLQIVNVIRRDFLEIKDKISFMA